MQHLPSTFHCLVIPDGGNGVYRIYITVISMLLCTIWYYSNAVVYIENAHNRHPIARTWGWYWGCLLWVQTLFSILLQCCITYHVILDPFFKVHPTAIVPLISSMMCLVMKPKTAITGKMNITLIFALLVCFQRCKHIYACVVAKN